MRGRSTVGCLVAFTLSILMAPLAAHAQPAGKVHRIGLFGAGNAATTAEFLDMFRPMLREYGWIEGQNIVFECRYAEGNLDRFPDFAAEFVRLPVDMLLAPQLASALAAKHATTTIPIVFFNTTDPVGRGLVASLARPGGNITGVAFDGGPEIFGKRLELLKAAVPTISRVAMLEGQVRMPTYEAGEKEKDSAARVLGLTLRYFYVQQREAFTEWVFPAITSDAHTIDALYATGPLANQDRRQIADFALQHQLPTIGIWRTFAEAGSLLSYGATAAEVYRRAAAVVDKILKGAQPADLPVEQPTKYELVINLKTAQALGLTIPPTLLFQADEVIR